MSVEGNLDLFQLPEILQLIAQQQKTGILTVQGQEDIVAISFLHGKIVAADSLNQAVEEGLKLVLVSTGVLSGADFARASSEQASTGQRLVDFLVEQRFVSRTRLLEALRVHTRQLLEKLLDWREGDFKFYSGDEVAYEEGFVPIRVDELLLHAGDSKPSVSSPAEIRPASPVRRAAAAEVDVSVPTPASPSWAESTRPTSGSVLGFPSPPPAVSTANRSTDLLSAIVVPFPTSDTAAGWGSQTPGIRQMTVEPTPVPRPMRHAGRLLGALAALGVIAVLIVRPGEAVYPFPWQVPALQGLDDVQRAAQFLKVNRAAETFFLLEGRFPESLTELRDRGMLGPRDILDPEERPLVFVAREKTYELHAEGRGGAEDLTVHGVSGNFLLDPEFLTLRAVTRAAPLVLLD